MSRITEKSMKKKKKLDKKNLNDKLYTILKDMEKKDKKTVDEIYQDLRQQIINRVIPPGEKLSEKSLAYKWNVSRTPIREVLRRLETEALAISHRNRGFIVNTITFIDIEQLYTIKISLEGLAGKLATAAITSDSKKLETLKHLCKEMERLLKKGDADAYAKKNDEFHYHILSSCGNKWLIKILENINSQVRRFIVKALHIPQRMKKSVKEHWEIYKQLEMRNERGVESAIGNHFKNSIEDMRNELIRRD